MKIIKRFLRNRIIEIVGFTRQIFLDNCSCRIICFHEIPEANVFKERLIWLKKNYKIIPLDSINIHENSRRIALTFDDGFECWHDIAFPILKELNIPACFFICTDLIKDKESEEKNDFIRTNLNRTNPNLRPLTKTKLLKLSESSLITIGAHTKSHFNLDQNMSAKNCFDQIHESIHFLEQLTGLNIVHFAYPRGRHEHISRQAYLTLKSSTIKNAYTTIPGFVPKNHDRLLVPRDSLEFSDPISTWEMWLKGGYFTLKRPLDFND